MAMIGVIGSDCNREALDGEIESDILVVRFHAGPLGLCAASMQVMIRGM